MVSRKFCALNAALLMVGLCLQGCLGLQDDAFEELRHYVARIKSRPPTPIEPIPVLEKYVAYPYPVHVERRSPFRAVVQNAHLKPDEERSRQPLEAFPLDNLHMVGILSREGQTWAVIQAPDDKLYRVSKGDYLGERYGQVTEILPKSIKLVELVPVAGGWENRPASLVLGD